MKAHIFLPLVVASVVAKTPPSNTITNIQDGIAAWKANNRDISPSFFQQCPPSCSELGDDPINWPTYASFDNLRSCTKSLSISFPVYTSLGDPSLGIRIRACTINNPSSSRTTPKPAASPLSTTSTNTENHQETAKIAVTGTTPTEAHDDILAAAHSLTSTSATIAFGSSRNVILGLYTGSNLKDSSVASSLLSRFIEYIEQGASLGDVMVVQLCGSKDRGSDFAFGIAVSTSGDIAFIQNTVKQWSSGMCAETPSADAFSDWEDVTFKVPPIAAGPSDVTTSLASRRSLLNVFQSRADCRTITVVSGDSCGSLASKCGISATDFTKFNPKSNLCSTLAVGQRVCCSSGSLPDITPKPNSDGTCATYTTRSGDYCAAIAANFGLTAQNIEDFNKNTWNWNGCDKLQLAFSLCLSTGYPPMPAPITDAQCGPQVPGTKRPTNGTALADLNPCPLNACCNIWGFCGTTDDFCTKDKTNNPNYCISHCGRDFVKGSPPAQYLKIGYFEAFNFDRPCLNAHIDWVDWAGAGYTHVHYAFASINPSDFNVNISAYSEEFERFKGLKGVKRVLSFGGWSFSTDLSTYDVLRSALAEDNRLKFRDNVLSFIDTHGLDGVDFDWEYPGAPDIPGIPPGQKDDGINYLLFLLAVWAELPDAKSLSIAAPASYWYLRGFPAELMAAVVDYVVYMTYDLHGQWDYGSGFANPGCPSGNCLRSHVNLTETLDALTMITKAGVPSNKVITGVSSYGRSFKMSTAGCTGPVCTFIGPQSGAKKGECTDTAGYISNVEINTIIAAGGNIQRTNDANQLQNILVYEGTEWVAYMDDNNKAARRTKYQGMNLGGTVDWAVDLSEALDTTSHLGDDVDVLYPPCTDLYQNLDDVIADQGKIPPNCIAQYVIRPLANNLTGSLDKYNQVLADGYDEKFGYYAKAVRQSWEAAMKDIYNNHISEYFDCIHQRADGNGGWHNETGVCPPGSDGYEFSVYLVPKDENKFFDWVADTYQVMRDWMFWDNLFFGICLGCHNPADCCADFGWIRGIPAIKSDAVVPNPKDSVASALDKLHGVRDYLSDIADDFDLQMADPYAVDVVDGSVVPVYMISEAINSMEQVADIGEEVEQKERESLILLILTAFLFVLPGLGEALGAVTGLAAIARIAAMIAEVGGAALGVYDIAENPNDPANVAMNIFGLLLGGVALRSSRAFADAAALKRGMSAAKLGTLGDNVKGAVDKVSDLVKVCRR